MYMHINVILSNTLLKKDYQATNHTNQAQFFLSGLDISRLEKLVDKHNSEHFPDFQVLGFDIVRGACHGFLTRIKPVTHNWGKNYNQLFLEFLENVAKAINWNFYRIDGRNMTKKTKQFDSS